MDMQTNIRNFVPLFQIRIIATGLKIFGRAQISEQLELCDKARSISDMVVGYDLVCEEDYNEGIGSYLDLLMEYKDKFQKKWGEEFQFYFHAGESTSRSNTELYDAILMGTKRIGHGFGLMMHPKLIELVRKNNICIECCPVSNSLLGYCHDLRTHPVRSLLSHGIAVSINPDDPGFFDTPGVTIDYVVAYLSWGLDLMDLKKLALNSLEHSTARETDRAKVLQYFDHTWNKFLRYVRGRY
jgi:adenosine deaminase CECR1